MTPDDFKDWSIWQSFFKDHVRYFNNAVLDKVIESLRQEQNDRNKGEEDDG